MKKFLSLTLCLLVYALASFVEARPFPASELHRFDHLNIVERCKAYFEIAAWDQARPHCIKAAESGDEESEYRLGIMGVNVEKLHRYWAKHAPEGHIDSQFGLAEAHFYGYPPATQRNHKVALFWYEKLAKKGYPRAQLYLGTIYELGRYGITQNDELAFDWYLKSANQDETIAQRRVGRMYLEGRGVEKDYKKAHFWLEKAISNKVSSNKAMADLGWMYEQGIGVEQDYQKAIDLYRDAARSSCSSARYFLGMLYYEGRGVEQDHDKAYELIQVLALCEGEDIDLMRYAGPHKIEDARLQLEKMNEERRLKQASVE